MIHLDSRIGSKHLLAPLQALGLPAETTTLEYGDIAFGGLGASGECAVGIEVKRLDDLVGSLSTKRFQVHQLPGLLAAYQWPILLVEGQYRESSDGLIEKGVQFGHRLNWLRHRSSMTYARLEGTLTTLMFACGFRIIKTRDTEETVAEVARLYRWWQKPWDAHQSHHVGSKGGPVLEGQLLRDPWFNRDRYFVEAVAYQVPGLGPKRAVAAAKHFRSVRRMAWAPEKEWTKVPGVGKVLAAQARAAFIKEL